MSSCLWLQLNLNAHVNSCFSSQTASAAQKPDRNLCRRSSAPRSLAYPADTYTLTTNTCRPRGRPTPHVSAVNLFIHTHVRLPTTSDQFFIHPFTAVQVTRIVWGGRPHTAPEGGDQLHANNNLRGGYRIIKIICPLTISLAGSELGCHQWLLSSCLRIKTGMVQIQLNQQFWKMKPTWKVKKN